MTSLLPRITALRRQLLERATERAITREDDDQFNPLLTAALQPPRDPLVLGLHVTAAGQQVGRADVVGGYDRLALALGEGAPTESRHDA